MPRLKHEQLREITSGNCEQESDDEWWPFDRQKRSPDDEEEGSKGGGNFKRRKPLPSLFREEQKVVYWNKSGNSKPHKQNADDGFWQFFKIQNKQNMPK
jgi:hypothetical protein